MWKGDWIISKKSLIPLQLRGTESLPVSVKHDLGRKNNINQSQGVFNHLNRVCFPLIFLVIVALMGDEGEDLRGVDFITVASCVSFCHSLLCSSFLFCFCPSFFLLLVLSSLYSSLLLSFFLPFLFSFMSFFLWKPWHSLEVMPTKIQQL